MATVYDSKKLLGEIVHAQVTSSKVTGVKGNSESSYRIGNVNLTAANVGAVPTSRTINSKALSSNISLTASDVGAAASSHTHNSLVPILLTNQNLNDLKPDDTTWYYAGGSNSVTNGPVAAGTAFGMVVYRTASGYKCQEFTANGNTKYWRYWDGSNNVWTAWVQWKLTDTTYNFSGTTFYSGNSGNAEHNANNAIKNGNYYYTSNGPATSLGASTGDGGLYVQSYSDSWVGQIAQDYRNGALFVRGKNNGTWQSWNKVYDSGHKPSASDVGALPVNGNAVTATTASKLGTATVGSSVRGIYLNAGTPTALSWYPDYCTINGSNTANYPWHRFATCTSGTGTYTDRDVIVVIHSRYNNGQYGIIKLSIRVNGAGGNIDTSATWIVRYGFAVGDVIISPASGSVGTDTRFNAYIKCATYPRRIAYILEGSNLGWSLISSNEPADTTSTDKKGGTEINASVTGKAAVDAGTVSYANSAGSATTCSYPAGFTSRTTGVTWGNTVGTSFTSWNTTNSSAIDFRYDNPSTGKLSIKVDGRFYFNEGNTPAAGLKSANGYWGLTGPDGEDNVWIRGTSLGFIPYQSGGATAGHGGLGTSSWYWESAYVTNVHANTLNGVTIGSSPKFTDTNTWRGIQNNLTSTSTTDSLSAAQGKALNDKVATKITSLSVSNATSASTTVSGSSTKWITITPPTNTIAMVGWYINGTTVASVYACRMNGSNGEIAVRNTSSSSVTFTITAQFLTYSKS